MEEKTKLLQLLHDREECENIISENIYKKQKTVEDIEKMMGSFSKVKPLIVKSLLDQSSCKLFTNVTSSGCLPSEYNPSHLYVVTS